MSPIKPPRELRSSELWEGAAHICVVYCQMEYLLKDGIPDVEIPALRKAIMSECRMVGGEFPNTTIRYAGRWADGYAFHVGWSSILQK